MKYRMKSTHLLGIKALCIAAILFLTPIGATLFAQEVDWQKTLEEEILKPGSEEADIAFDIFEWVTKKIAYQTDRKHQVLSSDPDLPVAENTYITQTGVCIGYARLYEELCKAAGIPVIVVEGVARSSVDEEMENHAWNIIQINDRWLVVDPTWASGVVQSGTFTFRFQPKFFDLPLSQRKWSHYPYDPALQIRDHPLTYQEFIQKQEPSTDNPLLPYREIINNYPGMQDTSALQRSLDYKPGDPFLQQALADSYMQNAEKLIQPCLESFSKGPSQSKVEECSTVINKTEEWLLKSQSLYQSVLNSDSPQKTSTKINLSNLSQNLKTLDQMKQFKS